MEKIAVVLLAVIVCGALVAGLSGVGVYNKLVSLSQGVDARWSQIENVYQRRADLVPNLVATVESSENRISVERMRFNETAQAYNTARQQFPSNIVARIGGLGEKAYFKAQAGAEQAPEVDFKFGASPAAPQPAAP